MVSRLPDLQRAVRELDGLVLAEVRWPDPAGPATLRVVFAEGGDPERTTAGVLRALRDVAGVELATVQAVTAAGQPAGRAERAALGEITVSGDDLTTSVAVTLAWLGEPLRGEASGVATPRALPRLAAAATLDAFSHLLPEGARVALDWLEVVDAAVPRRPAAVQSGVTYLTRGAEELYVGSALVRRDLPEAAARATLDALNRPLASVLA